MPVSAIASGPRLAAALTDDDFAALMAACGDMPPAPRLAVAISGGPDSTALTLLLQRWLEKRGGSLLALTIDHRLRPQSGQEAAQLGAQLARHGIEHRILTWRHEAPPQSGIHVSARRARYDLLLTACRTEGLRHLFFAHHAEDQAETILMRLSKSTGIDGLAGMSLLREQDGVILARPLLPVRKARLEATCKEAGWGYFSDPSNSAERFTRARLRNMHDSLAHAGFTVEKLLEVARDAGAARAQLETAANAWLENHALLNAYGVIALSRPSWRAIDHAMRLRILSRALRCAGGAEYPPRGASLDRLAAQLEEAQSSVQTLGGCRIEADAVTIYIMREAGLIADEAPLTEATPWRRWDNRFVFSVSKEGRRDGLTLRALHTISRKALEEKGADSVAALPAAIRAGLPGIFHGNALWGIPDFVLQAADLPKKVLVEARFSPLMGILIKPFCPSSLMLT